MNTNVGNMPLDIYSDYISELLNLDFHYDYFCLTFNWTDLHSEFAVEPISRSTGIGFGTIGYGSHGKNMMGYGLGYSGQTCKAYGHGRSCNRGNGDSGWRSDVGEYW